MKKLLLLTILLFLFVGFSVDRKEETTPELLQVTTIEAQRCEMMTDSSYCD